MDNIACSVLRSEKATYFVVRSKSNYVEIRTSNIEIVRFYDSRAHRMQKNTRVWTRMREREIR